MINKMWVSLLSGLVSLAAARIISVKIVEKYGGVIAQGLGLTGEAVGVAAKVGDLVDWSLFLVMAAVVGGLNLIVANRKMGEKERLAITAGLAGWAMMIYWQTFYVRHSGGILLGLLGIIEAGYLAINWWGGEKLKLRWERTAGLNGILMGFFLFIVAHYLWGANIFLIGLVGITPLAYVLAPAKWEKGVKSPGHIAAVAAAFWPYQPLILITCAGVGVGLGVIAAKINLGKGRGWYEKYGLPIAIMTIGLYNPLFYFGTYDSIEEGLWAGWLQRVIRGQIPYRDFAMYHPPLLLWGLQFWSKVAAPSLYTIRWYFHGLQMVGFGVMWLVMTRLVKSWPVRISFFLLVLALGSGYVRNNMEIRVAMGLVPILGYFQVNKTGKYKWLWMVGGGVILALGSALETGIASALAVAVGGWAWPSWSVKRGLRMTGVVITGVAAGGIILGSLGAGQKFKEYTGYYMQAFSAGYMNVAVSQPEETSLMQWYMVNRYASGEGFLWQIVKLTLAAGLFYGVYKIATKSKWKPEEILFGQVWLYTLIFSRSGLGRSDVYHITAVWFAGILIIAFLTDLAARKKAAAAYMIIGGLVLTVFRDSIHTGFLQPQFIRWQTWGNVSGNYPSYKMARGGITTEIDANPEAVNELKKYLNTVLPPGEKVFVYPLAPELYFLLDRENATSFDTPTAFVSLKYQEEMVSELERNQTEAIIYDPQMRVAGWGADSLPVVDKYIKGKYVPREMFGRYQVWWLKKNV